MFQQLLITLVCYFNLILDLMSRRAKKIWGKITNFVSKNKDKKDKKDKKYEPEFEQLEEEEVDMHLEKMYVKDFSHMKKHIEEMEKLLRQTVKLAVGTEVTTNILSYKIISLYLLHKC